VQIYKQLYKHAWESAMVEDVVRALGYLPLGTRLKRLGERLQSDTQRIVDAFGAPVQPALYPPLAALDRLGPLGIGEIAEALRITQPGATRSVAELTKLGLVKSEAPPDDQRRRVITLTDAGRAAVEQGKAVIWPRIEAAVRDLCRELPSGFLDQLAGIEDRLAERPLHRRAEDVADVPPTR
jgi:DNA-binding MarR family transcriptional regulator